MPILEQQFPNGRVLHEVPTAYSIADVLVVDSALHGYEIKSERDSLARLQKQIKNYARVCSRMTLVVARRHLDKAMSMLPEVWGVIAVRDSDLCVVREPQENTAIEAKMLLHMLWRDELLDVLRRYNLLRKGWKRLPLYALCPEAAKLLSPDVIVAEVAAAIKEREYARDNHETVVKLS